MSQHHPAPPRTQRRPSHRRTGESTATSTPLSEHFPRLARGCGIGFLVACLFCAVGSAIAAGILITLPDPGAPVPAVAIATLLLGSLVGASVAGKISGGRVLLCGLSMGALLLLAMYLATALTDSAQGAFPSTPALLLRGAVVLFCCFGTYLGAKFPTGRTRKRR